MSRAFFAILAGFLAFAFAEPAKAPDERKPPEAKAPETPEPPVEVPEPPVEGKEPPVEGTEPPVEEKKTPPPTGTKEPPVGPSTTEEGTEKPEGVAKGWAVMRPGGKPKAPPKMVVIEEGPFQMGATDQSGDKDTRDVLFTQVERPVRWVPKKVFCIDKTETTNEDYKKFIDETRYPEPMHWENGKYQTGHHNRPVVNVSLEDAKKYADWKHKRDGVGYRLPFEDEWEKAARGTDGRLWPWGKLFDPAKCNTAEYWLAKGPAKAGENRTMAIGSFPAGNSPYGLTDMAGNVWEWTQSFYNKYPDSTAIDKDFGEKFYVVRGGSWRFTKDWALCARRKKERKESTADDLGFRLVCDVIILKD